MRTHISQISACFGFAQDASFRAMFLVTRLRYRNHHRDIQYMSDLLPKIYNSSICKAHLKLYLHTEKEEPWVSSQTCCLLLWHSSLCSVCVCLHFLICVHSASKNSQNPAGCLVLDSRSCVSVFPPRLLLRSGPICVWDHLGWKLGKGGKKMEKVEKRKKLLR